MKYSNLSILFRQDRNEAAEAKEKSSGLFDPTAKAFQKSFKVTISLFVVAIVAGLIWHFGFYKRKKESRENAINELGKFIHLVFAFKLMTVVQFSGDHLVYSNELFVIFKSLFVIEYSQH